MKNKIKNKYDIGDIVFVNEYSYEDEKIGQNHLFVIIDDNHNGVSIEYFGLIVSSHIEKSNENSCFEYNEPLYMSKHNSLKKDSIVKCDQIYNIPAKNIVFKIGSVDVDDFLRFMTALQKSLNENKVSN